MQTNQATERNIPFSPKMMESLKKIAFEMDNAVMAMEAKIEVIHDVSVKFGHLREDMDAAVFRKQERLYYREHHREIRMLAELMRYLMNDLTKAHEEASSLKSLLFKIVVKGEAGE